MCSFVWFYNDDNDDSDNNNNSKIVQTRSYLPNRLLLLPPQRFHAGAF